MLAIWTVTSNKPWTKDGALLLATSNGSSFAVLPISLEADTNFENFSRNSWISTSLENISVVYGCLWWTGSRWREHIQLAKEPYFHKTKLAGSQAKQGLKYVWKSSPHPTSPHPRFFGCPHVRDKVGRLTHQNSGLPAQIRAWIYPFRIG